MNRRGWSHMDFHNNTVCPDCLKIYFVSKNRFRMSFVSRWTAPQGAQRPMACIVRPSQAVHRPCAGARTRTRDWRRCRRQCGWGSGNAARPPIWPPTWRVCCGTSTRSIGAAWPTKGICAGRCSSTLPSSRWVSWAAACRCRKGALVCQTLSSIHWDQSAKSSHTPSSVQLFLDGCIKAAASKVEVSSECLCALCQPFSCSCREACREPKHAVQYRQRVQKSSNGDASRTAPDHCPFDHYEQKTALT